MEIKTALNNVDFCIFSSDISFWMQWIGTEQEIDLLQDTTVFTGKTISSIKTWNNSIQAKFCMKCIKTTRM